MKTNHLKLLALSMVLSAQTEAVTRLVISEVQDTSSPDVFYFKTDKDDHYVKLDCESSLNYLYSRSDSDEELNFDFYLGPAECQYLQVETKTYTNPGNPVCLDVDFDQQGFILYRKCQKHKADGENEN